MLSQQPVKKAGSDRRREVELAFHHKRRRHDRIAVAERDIVHLMQIPMRRQRLQQSAERDLALVVDQDVDKRILRKRRRILRNLRSAEQDAAFRKAFFYFPGERFVVFIIPDITGKTDQKRRLQRIDDRVRILPQEENALEIIRIPDVLKRPRVRRQCADRVRKMHGRIVRKGRLDKVNILFAHRRFPLPNHLFSRHKTVIDFLLYYIIRPAGIQERITQMFAWRSAHCVM